MICYDRHRLPHHHDQRHDCPAAGAAPRPPEPAGLAAQAYTHIYIYIYIHIHYIYIYIYNDDNNGNDKHRLLQMIGRKLARMSEAMKHPGDEALAASLQRVANEITEEIRHLGWELAKAPAVTGQDNADVVATLLERETKYRAMPSAEWKLLQDMRKLGFVHPRWTHLLGKVSYYVYICIYTSISLSLYIYIYRYVYVYIYIYIHFSLSLSMYIYIYVYTYIYIERESDVCVYMCMYVCMYVYIYIYIYMILHI